MEFKKETYESLGTVLFQNADAKMLQNVYLRYVKQELRKRWASEVASITSLIDFRDYVEDTWESLCASFGVTSNILDFSLYQSILKSHNDVTQRRNITIAFLEENALSIHGKSSKTWPVPYIRFAIQEETEVFLQHAKEVSKFKPILKATIDVIEATMKEVHTIGIGNVDATDLQRMAQNLGLSSLWPLLALLRAEELGLYELFLHAPLPCVFGSPSCVRNAIQKQAHIKDIVRSPKTHISLETALLAGSGYVAYKVSDAFEVFPAPRAHYATNIPGMSNYIWSFLPKTREAAIYKCTAKGPVSIVEFDLPFDEADEEPNWIDCQRDKEGSIVLLWGHINALTGGLNVQNLIAFEETDILEDKGITFLTENIELVNRRLPGSRMDYRDHGNLLSVHHSVEDRNSESERQWAHTYDIVFGDHLLLSLQILSRPIESIYGVPTEMILLSPLSSTNALQLWTLNDEHKLFLEKTCTIPKWPGQAYWSTVCVL